MEAQLAIHKTSRPVINEVQNIPNQQAWVFEIIAYCNEQGISPDELIEQHKEYVEHKIDAEEKRLLESDPEVTQLMEDINDL